jgi:hypothetical protein
MANIRVKAGTRAQLNAAALAGQLNAREPYLITDETRLAVGTGPGAYDAAAKLSELAAKASTTTPVITGLREVKVAMPANNIDLAAGNLFTKTISTAVTLTVSSVPASGTLVTFMLDLNNGGAAVITWWSGMKWAGGTAPALTAVGRDVLGFYTHDGGNIWTGLLLAKDVK